MTTFIGTKKTDHFVGHSTIQDVFEFTPATLQSRDIISGGAGPGDVLHLTVAGVFAAAQFAHVTGIEQIILANGTNKVTLTDAMAASAVNHGLVLTGGTGVDTIDASALGKNEKVAIVAGAGNDVLIGGAGVDYLDGGTGVDTMTGGLGNDFYVVDSTADKIVEAANGGIDTVIASIKYTLSATLENLILSGTHSLTATGNNLDNAITGNAGNNVIRGGNGDDTLAGGGGTDTIYGGAGDDRIIMDVTLDLSNFQVDTLRQEDTIDGGGQAGDMLVIVSTDTSGGEHQYSHPLNVDLTKADQVSTYDTTVQKGFENVDASGMADATHSFFTGDDKANILIGTPVDDTMVGGAGDDTLEGGTGRDEMTGGPGVDKIYGGDGDDILHVNTGDLHAGEVYDGGAGADILEGLASSSFAGVADFSHDTLRGIETLAGFNDGVILTLSQAASIQQISEVTTLTTGGSLRLSFYLSPYELHLSNQATKLTIEAGSGTMLVDAGNGADQIIDRTQGNVHGGGGNDTLSSGANGATLSGDDGNDTLTATTNTDQFHENTNTFDGGAGNDHLTGGMGYLQDTLTGGAGNDVLTGNGGEINYLTGGSGADQFVFSAHDAELINVGGQLQHTATAILDFSGSTFGGSKGDGDQLVFSGLGKGYYIGTAAFDAEGKAEVRYAGAAQGFGILYVDKDGNGSADFAIDLTHQSSAGTTPIGTADLSPKDFLWK